MRALFVIGSIGLAIAAAAPSRAADYDYPLTVARAAPIVIYDYEPGIAVRAYWLAPWRNHHYFPHGQRIKAVTHRGPVSRRPPRPAQSFHREWSTNCGACAADNQTSGPEAYSCPNDEQRAGNDERVIHADADVTVLGPDRMNIRLFRKRGRKTE